MHFVLKDIITDFEFQIWFWLVGRPKTLSLANPHHPLLCLPLHCYQVTRVQISTFSNKMFFIKAISRYLFGGHSGNVSKQVKHQVLVGTLVMVTSQRIVTVFSILIKPNRLLMVLMTVSCTIIFPHHGCLYDRQSNYHCTVGSVG